MNSEEQRCNSQVRTSKVTRESSADGKGFQFEKAEVPKVISDYYAKTKEEFKSYHRGVVEELLVSCHG